MRGKPERKLTTNAVLVVLALAGLLKVGCAENPSTESPGAPEASGGSASGGVSSSSGGSGGSSAGAPGSGGSGSFVTPEPGTETECNDGIDNDGDGLVDAAFDPGCFGPQDPTESSGSREEELGFTTWEFGDDSVVVYVSEEGNDSNDGSSPEQAVRTITKGAELVRDGHHDFLLLRRGDTWRGERLGRFKSGQDAEHPLVIGSYGESLERPRVEVVDKFLNHDGQGRNFVAVMDLHLVGSSRIVGDFDFDGSGGALIRFVGRGKNLLVEGCHFEFGELTIQSFGDDPDTDEPNDGAYEDVEVRANVFERAYHRDTCSAKPEGDPTHRPSGMYSSHVKGLLLEGNLFDHNGWNDEVESACATIYNHNAYLNADDLRIINNVFARASSMHIKLRSDSTGDMEGTLIEDNFFVEGEIGVSIGGNSDEPRRFVSSTIRNNVMSDIGRSRPTTRNLGWGIGVQDNDQLLIADNLFLNSRTEGVGNTYAVEISGTQQKDLTIEDNLFYRWQSRALRTYAVGAQENVLVQSNTFVDPDQDSCLVDHSGSFAAYEYVENRYFSSAAEGSWFCGDGSGSLSDWKSASGETGAEKIPLPNYRDPERDIESYAATLELAPTLPAYLELATTQSRLQWRSELSARSINEYIRQGFEEQ